MFWYRRLSIKTACATNASAVTDSCDIVIGSNLLNKDIIDFNMNASDCNIDQSMSSHQYVLDEATAEKRSERRWLKENATFPEFVCSVKVTRTGCCGGGGGESSEAGYFAGANDGNTAERNAVAVCGFVLMTLVSLFISFIL